jgi:hypothetical protein
MTTPTPEPRITAVSFLIEHLGFSISAVLRDGGWALEGPAMDLVAQLSQHGGPPGQTYRWATPEAAEGAAVRLLTVGAQFVQGVAALDPARA